MKRFVGTNTRVGLPQYNPFPGPTAGRPGKNHRNHRRSSRTGSPIRNTAGAPWGSTLHDCAGSLQVYGVLRSKKRAKSARSPGLYPALWIPRISEGRHEVFAMRVARSISPFTNEATRRGAWSRRRVSLKEHQGKEPTSPAWCVGHGLMQSHRSVPCRPEPSPFSLGPKGRVHLAGVSVSRLLIGEYR